MEQKEKTIALVAGCSGGHIIPALTIANNDYSKYKKVFFAKNHQLDKDILAKATLEHTVFLSLINVPYKHILLIPKFLFQFGIAFITSFITLFKARPTKIISTGSYIALPVCLAGKMLQIPIELYELNVEPGLAIKLLSRIATKVHVCFASTQKLFHQVQCTQTNYPVRFRPADKVINKQPVYKKNQFDPARKTLFILGGSQGSQFLNGLIKQIIEINPVIKTEWQVIHQTGNDTSTDWNSFYSSLKIPAITFSYTNDIADYYALSDLIITRAGAGTLAEIAFFEKSCIVIPLTTATTHHQKLNASALAKAHPNLFHVLEQDNKMVMKISQQLS